MNELRVAHQRDAAVIPAAAAVNHDEGANGQGRGDENLKISNLLPYQ